MADLKDFSCFRTSTTLRSSFIISLCLLVVALRVKLKVAERRGEQSLKAWFPCDLETQWANGLRHFSHENRVKRTWHVYSRLINGHICLWWLGFPEYPMHTYENRLYGSQAQRNRNVASLRS